MLGYTDRFWEDVAYIRDFVCGEVSDTDCDYAEDNVKVNGAGGEDYFTIKGFSCPKCGRDYTGEDMDIDNEIWDWD